MAIGIGIGLTFGRRKGIDAQAQAAFNSLQSAGFTTPQGITGINAAFKTIKTIYGTSDITTAISFFGDPSLAYQIGAGSGTTLGQAIRTLPNIIDPTRATDAVQTTAASQPLLLTHTSGENYWWGSGVSGNDVTTPDAIANRFTGNIEYIVKCKFIKPLDNIGVSKYSGTNINSGFSWSINSSTFNAYYAVGGTAYQITFATSAFPTLNTDVFIKVIRNSSTGLVTASFSTNGTSYTTIGSLTGQTGAINGGSVPLCASTTTLTGGNQGYTYRATISNSIGGAPVVDFNPNQYNPSTSQTQWTSSTGEVWTINTGTATTGYKGVLVDRTTMQGDGIDDRMQATNYALTATGASVYSTYRKFASTSSGGFGVVVETGANTNTNQGILVDFNEGTNTSFNRIRGNVGTTGASFLDTSVSLKLITSVFDLSLATDEASFYAINNLALTQTGVANVNNTTMTTSGLNLMARSTAAGFANMTFNGIIISSNANGSTQRTAMYNYIRSINNAAF